MLLATVLCYMDRQVMSVVAPALQDQFHLSKERMGYVLAFFLWSYALFQTPVGWLLDRARTALGYALAVAVWSAAGMLTAFGRTVPQLEACRAMLGMAEAANWPAAMILVRRMFPPSDRALANGLFTSGSSIGATITPPIVVALVLVGGWPLPFLLLGGIGMLWVVGWMFAFSVTPLRTYNVPSASSEKRRRTDWHGIFTSRLFYALVVISLTNNSYWHFMANWLPTYLVKERSFTFFKVGFAAGMKMGLAASIPYLGQDVGCWLGGFLARAVAGRRSVEAGRRAAMTLGAVCAAMIWAAGPARQVFLCLGILFLGAMGQGMIGANYLAYCQDVSPTDTGAVAGLLGSVGALAGGFILPWAGRVADKTHSFATVFAVLSFFPMVVLFAIYVLKGAPEDPGRRLAKCCEDLESS